MNSRTDTAALLLRLGLGGLFLAHAGLKLFGFTLAGTAGYFASLGLPPALAYLTFAAEVLGGLALLAGFRTRYVALLLVPILLGAIATVHAKAGFFFDAPGGGAEFPLLWILGLIVLSLLGEGRYAVASRSTPARHAPMAAE